MTKQAIQAAAVLKEVAGTLYPGQDNWRSLLADELHVLPSSVKQWEKGHLKFDVYSHGVMNDMLNILQRRKDRIEWTMRYLERIKNKGGGE